MIYKKVLIAVDNSKYSRLAIQKGMGIAQQLGAEAGIVTVVDPTGPMGNAEAGIYSGDTWNNIYEEANKYIDTIAEKYNHLTITKFVQTGNPINEVVNTARLWNADLIVTGTHGRSGISHLIMGSVAESILKNADVPVMIVTLK